MYIYKLELNYLYFKIKMDSENMKSTQNLLKQCFENKSIF